MTKRYSMNDTIKEHIIAAYKFCHDYNQLGVSGRLAIAVNDYKTIKQALTDVAYFYDGVNQIYKSELLRIIDNLPHNRNPYTQNVTINAMAFAQLCTLIRVLYNEVTTETFDWWNYIHPRIIELSQKQFNDGHYSNAVKDAFIEICLVIKKYRQENNLSYITSEADMIRATISKAPSTLSFNACLTLTEKNIQEGYAKIFDGAIQGIRNQGAHDNANIPEAEAARKLMLASELMYKLDEAIEYGEELNS